MKFAKALLVSASFPLSFAAAQVTSKAAKVPKAEKRCPKDQQEAIAIGAKIWADLWYDIVTIDEGEGDCDPIGVRNVWDRYIVDEVKTSIQNYAIGIPGVDETMFTDACVGKAACLDFLPQGTTSNCAMKNSLTFSTHGAEIDPNDCRNFTVMMNEYVTYPENCGFPFEFTTGRRYKFHMGDYGKGEPMAKMYDLAFVCPYDVGNTLVGCPNGYINPPGYEIPDMSPGKPGCTPGFEEFPSR
jgi:hypothetical protein